MIPFTRSPADFLHYTAIAAENQQGVVNYFSVRKERIKFSLKITYMLIFRLPEWNHTEAAISQIAKENKA
ncbi:MAG: hypothetical protein QM689_02790 [Oscillospiraceae bacterium]